MAGHATKTILVDPDSGRPLTVDSSGNLNTVLAAGAAAIGNIGGQVSAGASVAGNPVIIAAEGRTTAAGQVSNGGSKRLQSTTDGRLIVKSYAVAELDWSYAAAASGIVNTTTAVTIKTAAGAGIKNYITWIDIEAEALGAATEVAIRDGAGGAVLWRTKIGTGGLLGGRAIQFPSPVGGTANTLLEVVTLTASVTGAVYFNAGGFTAQ